MVMTAASRNLPGPLGQAETAFRDCAARLPPVSGERLAQRAGHFAAGIRLSLDEPAAMRRLHEMTGGLRRAASLSTLLPRILDGALSLMGADFGTLQLLDPVTGSLRLVTQSGFTFAFLDHFAMVEDGYSACGRVAREGAQVVITDVEADQGHGGTDRLLWLLLGCGLAASSSWRSISRARSRAVPCRSPCGPGRC